jgi:protein SERAC1
MNNVPLADRVKQYGLTEVFSSPNPLVDVVFVHGLNGHPYNTWATVKPAVYWPADLLPSALEDQKCRLLTYGYDANITAFTDGTSKDRIHNHAEHLSSQLVANRSVSDTASMVIRCSLCVRRCDCAHADSL